MNFLTPKDVAAKCDASISAVRRWAEVGELIGHRTPGGRWRFQEVHVIDFMRRFGFLEPPARRQILSLGYYVPKGMGDVTMTSTAVEAAMHFGRLQPDLIVLGPNLGEGSSLLRAIGSRLNGAMVVAIDPLWMREAPQQFLADHPYVSVLEDFRALADFLKETP